MKIDEIQEGNKLIALFMDIKIKIYLDTPTITLWNFNNSMLRDIDMKYHASWDWLMPVIEKIESIKTDTKKSEEFQYSITGDGIAITQFDDGSGNIACRVNHNGKSKLQSSWEVVVEFIKWYNISKLKQAHKDLGSPTTHF